ncbi:multidrug efflux MFS transporter NorA [Paenibacillus woosongensis]|uniref:Multidrug efflux MFS transporter NorA n=1 Tax=Paenibacillus woosongensis TaxID=307580 RepID=A0AA95KV93_9BACL|nr:multidrug efflux MFS transporter NorA [Paenibacillus woosongensis]WHX48220.1 multidrug efflux MFS transporter NorA [Paenibacillus woosongensis]
MKNPKITLAILLTNLFIAFLGIGLVIPVLPTIMNELNISGKVVGYMVSVFAITQLISSPFAGRWVDKYGRKVMIVLGLFIFGFSEFLFGLGKTVEVLFVSRMLGGISAAFIMPAVTAFIADITTSETRPKALGYMSAAISTGFIIGPGFGGFLAEIGTRLPFYTAGLLGGLAAILSLVLLKEPERAVEDSTKPGQTTGLRRVFLPMYSIAFILIFVSSFGLAAFESLFSLFVDHKFGFTPKDIAIVITGGALVGAIAQILLFDHLIKRLGEINVIRYCLGISTVLVLLMTYVSTYFIILLTTFVLFTGFDLMRPAITSYLSKIAGNEQGFVGGMNSTFTSIGNIFGPIVGGALFDINLNYPYYFAAIVLLIGTVIALFWKKPEVAEG